MRSKPSLTAEDTARILQAAEAEAAQQGWAVTIAIVDEAGYLLRLARQDGAPVGSSVIATGKARTAALLRRPSGAVEETIKARPAFGTVGPALDVVAVQGGVPLTWQGECVGGIGVSGVQSHEDEQIAKAGAAALGAAAAGAA